MTPSSPASARAARPDSAAGDDEILIRRRGIAIVVRWVGPYLLAAALGGAVVWLCIPTTRPDPVTSAPDPLRTSPSDYEWARQPDPAFPLPPYARFLNGVTIVLDPGHGGRADRPNWKRGPTGLREAEVNLRVALFLRDFLEAAGAEVVLTRESDVYLHPDDAVDLRARIDIANQLQADLFLSIHHNAGGNASMANYTSVFYHATPDRSPASLDAAGHLLAGLNDALRLEQHVGCALVSDYAIFPGRGFAVLRAAEVPAVLTEASFHSHPGEERRLRDPVYNRREAYGLFLGLARWAQAGLPRIGLAEPADGRVRPGQPVVIALDDGLSNRGGLGADLPQVRAATLVVEIDGRAVRYTVDFAKGELRIEPTREMIRTGGRLYVDFTNVFGQHVLHPVIELEPGRGGE
jgi:N-acetylmuramoyl-L-alanine amidase